MADPAHHARAAKARRDAHLRELRDRTLPLVQALETRPQDLRTTSLWTILLATHGMGEIGAKQVCRVAKVWPFMPLGQLTDHQVRRIIAALPKRVTNV